jgi:hypothetical protein
VLPLAGCERGACRLRGEPVPFDILGRETTRSADESRVNRAAEAERCECSMIGGTRAIHREPHDCLQLIAERQPLHSAFLHVPTASSLRIDVTAIHLKRL